LRKRSKKLFSGCRGLYGRGWFFGARNTVNFLLRHRREVAQLRDLNVTVEGDKTVHSMGRFATLKNAEGNRTSY
jgi:hypothetical protein